MIANGKWNIYSHLVKTAGDADLLAAFLMQTQVGLKNAQTDFLTNTVVTLPPKFCLFYEQVLLV